jgi:hypothetical protein
MGTRVPLAHGSPPQISASETIWRDQEGAGEDSLSRFMTGGSLMAKRKPSGLDVASWRMALSMVHLELLPAHDSGHEAPQPNDSVVPLPSRSLCRVHVQAMRVARESRFVKVVIRGLVASNGTRRTCGSRSRGTGLRPPKPRKRC